jgi:hypothetical protein
MADSVVRNANKDDIPIFDPDTEFGDQYLMERQSFDDSETLSGEEIIRRMEEDEDVFNSYGQDRTGPPEPYIEPMDAIRGQMLEFRW